MMINPWWALALFAIFLIGVTKSGFGSGVGLIIIPMMTIAMSNIFGKDGAEVGLGILLPLLIVGDVIALWQYRKLANPMVLKRLGIGAAIGISIGGLMLWWFQEFKTIAGALVMMMTVLTMFGTLISDVLLAWVDPRIRFEAGGH